MKLPPRQPGADAHMSHPSRVRGLKPGTILTPIKKPSSHPSRVRGLKLSRYRDFKLISWVAPFAGAWIETISLTASSAAAMVAPFAGAWIETSSLVRVAGKISVAPFAGAWIETGQPSVHIARTIVAPFAGAWIETPTPPAICSPPYRRTLRGCVD